MQFVRVLRCVLLASVAGAVACGAPDSSTAPAAASASATGSTTSDHRTWSWWHQSSPELLSCPVSTTTTTSALIGVHGGTISLGGSSVTIPAGALLGTQTVELTIPAGHYMEVDLSVNGGQSIIFQLPVVATIDYSRCGTSAATLRPLSVWHIDEHTKALLENMGGVDDKLLQQITFTTGHFSGYAVAN